MFLLCFCLAVHRGGPLERVINGFELKEFYLRPFAWNHNNVGICWHLLRIV